MKILGIDTSGTVASVALSEDGRLIASSRLQYKLTHSETLMPMMETIKDLISLDMNSLDYIAVTCGPGSFTGLRIGAAAAKGVAGALGKNIIPVPTLDTIAWQMFGTRGLICPMLDARRAQVYTGVYEFVPESVRGDRTRLGFRMNDLLSVRAVAVEEIIASLIKIYKEKYGNIADEAWDKADKPCIYLMGDGVPVVKDRIKELLTVPYTVVPFHRDRQSAEAVCALAEKIAALGKSITPEEFDLTYLRPSQAQRVKEELKAGDGSE